MAVTQTDIQTWIGACLKKDKHAQKMLFQHFYGFVMSTALRYCSVKEDAEEVLNDAFYKCYKNLNIYDVNQPFENWLHRIVTNTAIDFYRKKKRLREKEEVIVKDLGDNAAEDPNILAFIENSENDVLPLIQSLSTKYRQVFNLYVFENYSHNEISKKLNISVGTSKSNLSRAKKTLVKTITETEWYKTLKKKAYGFIL